MNTVLSKSLDKAQLELIRKQFPILDQRVNGKPLIYFDNAASSQKPEKVISAIDNYYRTIHANVHRGVHHLSNLATTAQENARRKVADFLGAASTNEIIFTKGATESLNLAAHSLGSLLLEKGDEVLVSTMEHHANIVPWQMACALHGTTLKTLPINDSGELDDPTSHLSQKTRILAINHVSNTLGTINDLKPLIAECKKREIVVVVDGAQATPHMEVDVQDLNCDLYAFSAHKMYGPTGVGVLYGKEELLERMPPYQGGGEMIDEVSFERTTFAGLPFKFEAGTPNVAGIVGLGAAIDWLNEVGITGISLQEDELLQACTQHLRSIPGLRIIGEAANKAGVISFVVDGVHHYDLGTLLDQQGIAVRTGHHCTQPLMSRYDVTGTTRASFAVYNTMEEVEIFVSALSKSISMLR